MPQPPLISVVVPSFNQAPFLGETLQSLADQNYPNLEVIIEDDCSSDNSVEIARRFVEQNPSQFKLFTAKQNEGQAAALNRGFRRARGEILAFLNSDDTLLPGCLSRVASEIDPRRSRYVVFGRCIFTGSGSRYVGVEHPAFYRSHFEMLAIWKRRYNTIPQPSVFWHRSVMERCGYLDKSAGHVLDYDLFCRFSRRYHFHHVDMLWSTYRMHANSRSSQRTEDEVLEASIVVSRRYWGPRWSP
ncbi:MAG TPA: glycosyltransferase family 2 protein, partial [Bryobacteraceae bacterium]|nr:glycosyltransferase family 2 protein [Bryobacteraceae bacterium]